MAADERVADDDFNFWALHIPRPWSRVVAEAITEHDQGAGPQPTPEAIKDMSMAEFAARRERFGIKSTGDVLGSRLWTRPGADNRSEGTS